DGEPEPAEVPGVAGALGDEKAHAASARCCGGLQNIRGPGGRQSDSGRGCVARWLLYILSVRRTPRRTSERSTVMAKKNTNAAAKDPGEGVHGDEPMTAPQESYLNTLAREAGTDVPEDLTKAEASEKIEELQEKTGRGKPRKRPGQPRAA